MKKIKLASLLVAACAAVYVAPAAALLITPTTTSAALIAALGGGGGLTVTNATVTNGAASQVGTYTGFSSAPVTIGNGVVLSSGQVAQVLPAFNNGLQGSATTPSTATGAGGTTEFNTYGPGHITNFSS